METSEKIILMGKIKFKTTCDQHKRKKKPIYNKTYRIVLTYFLKNIIYHKYKVGQLCFYKLINIVNVIT